MNYYGKAIVECLTEPRTLLEVVAITGFNLRYILDGIENARADGYRIVARPGDGEGVFARSIYTLEDRPNE